MRIALVHTEYDSSRLIKIRDEMIRIGAPKIHAVWMDCYDHWQALEGCHRLRAAYDLGLTPEIIEVDYTDQMCSSIIGYDGDSDYMVSEICDDGHRAKILEYQEIYEL